VSLSSAFFEIRRRHLEVRKVCVEVLSFLNAESRVAYLAYNEYRVLQGVATWARFGWNRYAFLWA